jgi:hypothetical protein
MKRDEAFPGQSAKQNKPFKLPDWLGDELVKAQEHTRRELRGKPWLDTFLEQLRENLDRSLNRPDPGPPPVRYCHECGEEMSADFRCYNYRCYSPERLKWRYGMEE